jgi:hypothetical protein
MPTTLEDLYAHPKFVEKFERPIKAKIMSWKFQAGNSRATPSAAKPIAVSLNNLKFSDEDEERIQGEVIVSARVSVDATVTTQLKEQTADQAKDVTKDITQTCEGSMNFSLPWGWQDREIRFVAESAQVALTDLRRS